MEAADRKLSTAGTLTILGGIAGLVGATLTIVGAVRWAKYARLLKRFGPVVDVDPERGRYTVSMRLSF